MAGLQVSPRHGVRGIPRSERGHRGHRGEDDKKVWVRVEATGTHTGDWNLLGASLPATGKSVAMNQVFIWRIADGQLAEGWEVDDILDFLQTLGVVGYTELGKPIEEVFR